MEHNWKSTWEDCAQLGMNEFRTCTRCGLGRMYDNRNCRLDGLSYTDPYFSMDCDEAQKELRLYIRGRIDGLTAALEGGDPEGYKIVSYLNRAMKERTLQEVIKVLQKVQNIKGRPSPREVRETFGFEE